MKYFVISVDTNGFSTTNSDVLAICIQQIDFSGQITTVKEDLNLLIKGVRVGDTSKYHKFTDEDIEEFGLQKDLAILEFYNYIFDENEDLDMSNISFVGFNMSRFTIPFLKKFLGEQFLEGFSTIDVTSAFKILLNTDSFSETLDVIGIKNENTNCFHKVVNIIEAMRLVRGIMYG